MNEDNPQGEIDDSERKSDKEFGELEGDAADMEDRLEQHESGDDEVEVPEPDQGESLSISEKPGEDEVSPVEEDGIPEDQGEAAGEAGQ